MKKYLVKVSDKRHESYEIERRILEQAGAELRICNCLTTEDMLAHCSDADGILLDMAPMNAEVVAALHKCRVISRYGVGFDNVDVAACSGRGIMVANVPDYCAEDVSDHAAALLFSCLRQIPLRDRLVRQGQWNISGANSFRIRGKTLGVVGGGRIAMALIRKMKGFGLSRILVFDPYVSAERIAEFGGTKTELEDLLRESDLVSLHAPVTAETRGIINARTLSLMKPTAFLINTGRGPLVDDAALLQALKEKKIAGAGLDTHNQEPLPGNSEYLALDNVVLTDHTAYNTQEAVAELKTKAAENIAEALCGRKPKYLING